MTGYAFKVRPLEGGFVSRDLTTSSRNHISGVRFWKDNFGRFTDTTDRETIYSPSTVESSSWTSGPSTPMALSVDSFTKHASDCSSSRAYTLILLSGFSSWWSQTGTMSKWEVPWSKPFIWQTSTQWEIDISCVWSLETVVSWLGVSGFCGGFQVSSCRHVGWGPLQVLQAFFPWQSLFTWPHLRQPQHRRLVCMKLLLSVKGKCRNLSQASISWVALQ